MYEKNNNLYVTEHFTTRNNSDYILMDVNTLDVYILNELEMSLIKAFKKGRINVKRELNNLVKEYGESLVVGILDQLFINGILRSKEVTSEHNSINQVSREDDIGIINAVDILLSNDCNLACKYCFHKKERFSWKKSLMSFYIGKKIIDFLIKRSESRKELFVCFFGGEPLLNFKVLRKIVNYALSEGRRSNKHFNFSITTNGTLLTDKMADFICEHKIEVLISIDGDKYSHNLNRPMRGSNDSYLTTVNNLGKLEKRNISYSARATVTSFTKDKITETYEHLLSLGFKKIHFENALAPEGKIFITDKNDISDIKKQYSLISKKICNNISRGLSYNVEAIPLPLERIVTKKPNFYSCSAGKGYVSVNVNGDVFLCHRLVGEKAFFLGNVIEDTYSVKWSEIIRNEINVENRAKCRKCWARYICGGGCYGINYDFNKDISLAPGIYCQLMKYSIKKALCVFANAASQPEVAEQ